MQSDATILAFDTSAAHCAAALLKNGEILDARVDAMAKGQAEHLIPMLQEFLAAHGMTVQNLHAIAVGIGPGNFTGIRISVSAARGMALSLGIPAIGISTFEVMRDPTDLAAHSAELVSVKGPKDTAYVQRFSYGQPQGEPEHIDLNASIEHLELPDTVVRGFRADEIAAPFGAPNEVAELSNIPQRIARCAHWRMITNGETPNRPVPLYARAPDAAPSKIKAPRILA